MTDLFTSEAARTVNALSAMGSSVAETKRETTAESSGTATI